MTSGNQAVVSFLGYLREKGCLVKGEEYEEPDENIIEYLKSGAESLTVQEVGEFIEMVAGFCDWVDVNLASGLSDLTERYSTLRDEILGVDTHSLNSENLSVACAPCDTNKNSKPVEAVAASSEKNMPSCKNSASYQKEDSQGCESSISSELNGDGGNVNELLRAKIVSAVEILLELSPPGSNKDVLAHMFQYECACSLDDAAQWLLNNGYEAAQRSFNSAQEMAKLRKIEEEETAKRQRDRILERFDEQIVNVHADTRNIVGKGKPGAGLAPTVLKTMSRSGNRSMRYIEGRQVAMQKGQKYLVENLSEEWDGGSRGRVKTKGKRGVGWA